MITVASNLDEHIDEANIIATGGDKFMGPLWSFPMAMFIRTLKPPKNLQPDSDSASRGKLIFQRKCQNCHTLSNGAGNQFFKLSALVKGASEDHGYMKYAQAIAGQMTNGANYPPSNAMSAKTVQLLSGIFGSENLVVRGFKPKRLSGVSYRSRLMSNGKIRGLEHLFCLNGKTRKSNSDREQEDLTEMVHQDLCEDYSAGQKSELIEFLKGL